MKFTLVLLAAAAAVQASPVPVALPGAVTSKISPSGKPPPGCSTSYSSGFFGIAVMNVTATPTSTAAKLVSTISDGQPQNPTGPATLLTTISDGQPQAPTSVAVLTTISDGQPQAPTKATTVPALTTISDGQPQAPTSVAVLTTISDGQPQAPTKATTVPALTTISDGQPQAPTSVAVLTTISDGQPQAPTTVAVLTTISDGQPQAPTKATTVPALTTISDGQPQAPTTAAVLTTISDGQPQAPTKATAVSTISDGQPQAPTATPLTKSSKLLVACKTNHTLQIELVGGVLTDNLGRTGYIASNYQFQFDKPPQAGAIYTAGWSLCANGSLALGGSNIFYQCLSGNFFNLYNKDWAAQCNPITMNAVALISC
jgi:hypothetical protein